MKAYLPEWKIYLWKKLLLDKGNSERMFQPSDFIYFDQDYQQGAVLGSLQRSIDRIRNIEYATAKGEKVQIDTSADPAHSEEYYSFEPREVMLALIELAEEKPKCLDIGNIELRDDVIHKYRQKRKEYLSMEKRKHLASHSSSRAIHYVDDSKPDNRFADPFCELTEHVYKKVEKSEKLSLSEFKGLMLNNPDESVYPSIHFKIRIDKKNLLLLLNAYVTDFMSGELIPPQGIRLFKFDQQRNNILSSIKSLSVKYGGKNMALTFKEVARCGGWENKDEHHYRFYETLFALEKMGEITITDLRKDEVIISLIDKPIAEEKTVPRKELSLAEKRKLSVLEKIKEEWDLAPKNTGQIKIKISGRRAYGLMAEIGIDYFQLESILLGFKAENLIVDYKSINPAM
jgi:hypothetical protein